MDFDGKIERSDFDWLNLGGRDARQEAVRAGVKAAGASLLGIEEPAPLVVRERPDKGDDTGKWVLGAAVLLAIAIAVRR